MIEIDPVVQRAFDADLADYRSRVQTAADRLRAEQQRLASERQRSDDRFAAERAAIGERLRQLAREAANPDAAQRRWQPADAAEQVMSFGPEEPEDEEPPARVPEDEEPAAGELQAERPSTRAVAPRQVAPPPQDEEDLSEQTWLR